MDGLDKKIKQMWNKVKTPPLHMKSKNCPGDSIIIEYINGILNQAEKEHMEKHLIKCNYCLDLIRSYKKVSEDEAYEISPDVPQEWSERAMDLMQEKEKDAGERFFDIVLRCAQDAITIIDNPGNLLIAMGAGPAPLRGKQIKPSSDRVILSKKFGDMECRIEIEKMKDDSVNFRIVTKEADTHSLIKGLRISLFHRHREIASYIAESGEISFENIPFGEHEIRISKMGKKIGNVTLHIKD